MKTYSYKSVWHDHGFVVFRSDGKRLPFSWSHGLKRRLTSEECQAIGAKLTALPGAHWKRFSE